MPIKHVKMISKGSHRYGTRMLRAGDEFDATGETDAKLLTALGRAERAEMSKAAHVPEAAAPRAAKKVAAKKSTRFSPASFIREFQGGLHDAPTIAPDCAATDIVPAEPTEAD
jgi:hypothetical protein